LGKLLAIDVFETLGDQRACSTLITLLRNDDATVVEWAARALGSLGCREAVASLLELRARLVATRVPPDWTGPVALRHALSDLGARQAVVPVVSVNLKVQRPDTDMELFRSADLTTVIEDLAGASQVILYQTSRSGASATTATSTGFNATTRSGRSTGPCFGPTTSRQRTRSRVQTPPS
jgi:hypothetical protein